MRLAAAALAVWLLLPAAQVDDILGVVHFDNSTPYIDPWTGSNSNLTNIEPTKHVSTASSGALWYSAYTPNGGPDNDPFTIFTWWLCSGTKTGAACGADPEWEDDFGYDATATGLIPTGGWQTSTEYFIAFWIRVDDEIEEYPSGGVANNKLMMMAKSDGVTDNSDHRIMIHVRRPQPGSGDKCVVGENTYNANTNFSIRVSRNIDMVSEEPTGICAGVGATLDAWHYVQVSFILGTVGSVKIWIDNDTYASPDQQDSGTNWQLCTGCMDEPIRFGGYASDELLTTLHWGLTTFTFATAFQTEAVEAPTGLTRLRFRVAN